MKTVRFIDTMLLAMILLVSCGGGDDPVSLDKPDVPDKPTEPSITVPNGEEDYFSKGMTFDTNADEKSFSFQTDVDWTISVASTRSGESWCSVSPTSGKAGKHTVKVKTEANTTYDDRQVTLTLTAGSKKKTISISQKQQDALTLTKEKFEVDAKGGTIEVEVKANISYEVNIPEASKGWISKSTKSRVLTASTLVFDIAESEESEKREGEIVIKSGEMAETIHVYQSGQKILLLSKNIYNVAAEGDTILVELKSNCDYGIKMPEADWISEMKGSRATSSHTLYYIIKANETYEQRNAKIVFFDKNCDLTDTLHVVQYQKNALIVGPKEFNVKAEGEDIQVKVSHNVEYCVDIKDDWITKTTGRSLTEDNLTFTIKPNETNDARIGKITFVNKRTSIEESIIIYQSRKGNTYHVAKAGTLSELIGDNNKYNITEIKLSGELNSSDIRFLREMAGQDYKNNPTKGTLHSIDMSDTRIVEGGDCYLDFTPTDYDIYYTEANKISGYMFFDCSILTNIILPNSITSIDQYAFGNCTFLTKIKIPNSVTTIGNHAFEDCRALVNVEIPKSVKNIENRAFQDCNSLTSIKIPSSVTILTESVFSDCNSLTNIEIPNSITTIEEGVFGNCTGLTTLTIPNSVKTIGDYAFSYCSNLTSVYIPNSVTSIGSYVFYYCTKLKSFNIPNSIKVINDGMFYYCSSLTSVEIPESITSIGSSAFDNCTNLPQIKIPKSVKSIATYAIRGCTNLQSIFSFSSEPPTLQQNGILNTCKIYVPKGFVDKYKAAEGWKDHAANIFEIPEGVTEP